MQKTWYQNDTELDGQTVFWDTGFILLKGDEILLHSAQIGGRMEQYQLVGVSEDQWTFNSESIAADLKTIRSQRIFDLSAERIRYELNMATHQAPEFQNHLKAELIRL